MKKSMTTLALSIFTLVGVQSFAQSLNINGGFTSSTLKGGDMSEEENEYTETYNGATYTSSTKIKDMGGFNAALGYEFRLGERLSLEAGVKYQSRGYKALYKSNYEDFTYGYSQSSESSQSVKINYLDIPLVLNTAVLAGDFRLYLRTGVYAGMLTSAKFSSKSEYIDSDGGNSTYEESETMSGSEFEDDRITGGIVFGIGAEYKGFYLEANYNRGVFSLMNNDYDMSTRDFSISLGYKIKFNK